MGKSQLAQTHAQCVNGLTDKSWNPARKALSGLVQSRLKGSYGTHQSIAHCARLLRSVVQTQLRGPMPDYLRVPRLTTLLLCPRQREQLVDTRIPW